MKPAKRIAVTGAAGQIGYCLLPRLANGDIFGPEVPVHLRLLEVSAVLPALEGVRMELDDCAFPLLQGVVCTDRPELAFQDADLVLLVGSKPRGKGQERNDLIRDNSPIFIGQGRAIGEVAGPDVRVVVVGNPCNTNCLVAMHNARGVPGDRFTAMTRLDLNRANAQLATKADVPVGQVKNVIIWGNHSNTQFPDWAHATIAGKPAAQVIGDRAWLEGAFVRTVQERGKAVIDARGKSSAFSAASAAIDHCRSLYQATPKGEHTALCVLADGSYDIPPGIICSFPCRTDGRGGWSIVRDLRLDTFSRSKVQLSVDELLAERDAVRDQLS